MTKQPPAVPLPGPNVTPEPNEKIKGLATQNKPQDTLQIRKTSCGLFCVPGKIACQTLDFFHSFQEAEGRQEAVSSRRARCFPDLKGVLWLILCGQTLDFFIRFRSDVWPRQRDGRRLFRHAAPGCFPDLKGALARRDETASCPEPNEKIKGLAGNCSRHTNQATRHPSNQENTLARRDETAQAHKPSHKTPFKSGKHLVAWFVCLEQLPARPLIFSFGSGQEAVSE